MSDTVQISYPTEKEDIRIVAVLDFCNNTANDDLDDGDKSAVVQSKYYTNVVSDGFLYTIRRNDIKRPELCVLCGPENEMMLFSEKEIENRIDDAAEMVERLLDQWSYRPLDYRDMCISPDGRIYICQDQQSDLVTTVKSNLMKEAIEYYGNKNFNVMCLVPVGWKTVIERPKFLS